VLARNGEIVQDDVVFRRSSDRDLLLQQGVDLRTAVHFVEELYHRDDSTTEALAWTPNDPPPRWHSLRFGRRTTSRREQDQSRARQCASPQADAPQGASSSLHDPFPDPPPRTRGCRGFAELGARAGWVAGAVLLGAGRCAPSHRRFRSSVCPKFAALARAGREAWGRGIPVPRGTPL
jgi:hypothetical protein